MCFQSHDISFIFISCLFIETFAHSTMRPYRKFRGNGKVFVLVRLIVSQVKSSTIEITHILRVRRVRTKYILVALVLLCFIIIPFHPGFTFSAVKGQRSSLNIRMLVGQTLKDQFDIKLLKMSKESTANEMKAPQPFLETTSTFYNKLKDTYSVYASYLAICLENGDLNPILPFSWVDWYDSSPLSSVQISAGFGIRFGSLESQTIKETRGGNYTKSLNYDIEKLIFVNSNLKFNYIVRVFSNFLGESSIHSPKSGMISILQMQAVYSSPVDIKSDFKKISQLHEKIPGLLTTKRLETRSNMDFESFDGDDMFINLHVSDFEFDLSKRVDELRHITRNLEVHPSVVEYYNNIHKPTGFPGVGTNTTFEKFFHEVELENDPLSKGSHYDWRFFKRVLEDKERYFAIHHLVRTWQEFANKEKIIYWLSHGNLLAWRWSGSSFLWDHDCDLQLPIKHLEYLAVNFNGSLIIEDPKNGLNRYLIEVNPYFTDRENANGNNCIDGRIIDITTGLYIDLTAISLNFEAIDSKHKIHLGDKHIHRYDFQSLSPLRSTLYEGVPSWVPHDTDFILAQEYPSGLVQTKYDDYEFLPELSGWLKNPRHCLNQDSPGVFVVPTPNSKKFCDNLTLQQVSHLLKFWNMKKVENQFTCFNKINCIPPISSQALEALIPSQYYDSFSNVRLWDLSEFSVEGLRKLVNSFYIAPIPNSDMSKVM